MTEFDDDLATRLARLDDAIPASTPPVVASRGAGPKRRRQVLVLLAAAAIALFGVTAITALATPPPPDPAIAARDAADEERLRDDLGVAIGGRCLTADQATALVHQRLTALGLAGWTIRDDGRHAKSPCVGAAASADVHEVLLMPSMGGKLAGALDVLEAHLIRDCLNRDDAVAALRAVLVAHGIANPRIDVGGVTQVPIEGTDAYLQHVRDGCFVYGHAQFDQQGAYTWFVSGP